TRPGGKCRGAVAAGACSRSTDTTRRPAGKCRRAPARSTGKRGPLSRSGAAYRWATREAPASSTAATEATTTTTSSTAATEAASSTAATEATSSTASSSSSTASSTPGDGWRNDQGECYDH